MQSHFLYMVLFAVGVGIVLGGMLRGDVREASKLAALIALGLVGAALVLAWAMYLLSP